MSRGDTYEGKPCRHGHGNTRYRRSGRCVICRRNQANAEYAADKATGRARANAWRAANPKRKRENDTNWRAKNLERKRENDAAWRAANPERVKRNKRRWQVANRERHNASNRRSAKRNPIAGRTKLTLYRSRKRGAEGHFTRAQVVQILSWQNGCCSYCDVASGLQIDHVIPLARDGSNWPWNLQWLCEFHNKSKAAKTDCEYRSIAGLPSGEPISVSKWRKVFVFFDLTFPEPF